MLDLHTHVVPAGIPFAASLAADDPRWARLERGTTTGDVLVAGKVFRTVPRVAWDLHHRRESVEAEGGTGQLLSAMPELLASWAPARQGLDFARAFNDWLADELPGHDGFFTGLGVVPLADPEAAAAELGQIAAAGLSGVELPANPPTAPLHAPEWSGFLDEAERLGLLVFLHAVGSPAAQWFPQPMAANGVLFPNSIGEGVAGLIATGALARRPRLRILASHGGGSLPAQLARLDFLRDITPPLQELMPEPATVSARRVWFDPLLFDTGLLSHLVTTVGADRIVLGTDYPFMPVDPVAVLDDPALPAGLADAVRHTNPGALIATLRSHVQQRS
ncbi:amidohydrolase family protein [Amycolatopsis sp. NPDC051903]|uniref:amidohydrolase family protein n=1 Tax=Amycolatopsis sp. NPDC051903 TaxID=3363936 RepID=UPI0037B20A51